MNHAVSVSPTNILCIIAFAALFCLFLLNFNNNYNQISMKSPKSDVQTPTEKKFSPQSGFGALLMVMVLISVGILSLSFFEPIGIFLFIICLLMMGGFVVVAPNQSVVLLLFGSYIGTIKKVGFFWTNPFTRKQRISLRARNATTERIKVNDALGNPIIIGAVIVWQVKDTARAAFEVEDYEQFVGIQSEAAVRNLAGMYPYDNFDDDKQITLRAGAQVVNQRLEIELAERFEKAGIEVLEARLTHLAYAEEIAGAMLQRQQATAIIAARKEIVEGAVGMVEMALEKLARNESFELSREQKAAMISNLLVVLCADKTVQPVIGTQNG